MKYKYVTAKANSEEVLQTAIVDSNVLIQGAQFYFQNRDASRREKLKNLLSDFPYSGDSSLLGRSKAKHLIYGFALQETCMKRDGKVDHESGRKLLHAWKTMCQWDVEKIRKEFSRDRAPVERDKDWYRKTPIDALGNELSDALPADNGSLILSYASLLQITKLEVSRGSGAKSRINAFEKFLDWTDAHGRGAYEINLATHFFLGENQKMGEMKKIMKFDPAAGNLKRVQNCWNAAWDIWFVRLLDGVTHNIHGLRSPHVTGASALITENIDPVLLRAQNEISILFDLGSEYGTQIYARSGTPPEYKIPEEIRARLDTDPIENIFRSAKFREQGFSNLQRFIRDYEVELELEDLTKFSRPFSLV